MGSRTKSPFLVFDAQTSKKPFSSVGYIIACNKDELGRVVRSTFDSFAERASSEAREIADTGIKGDDTKSNPGWYAWDKY